jgi:hypothetical protein
MFFSIGLLILIVLLAFKFAPREKAEDSKIHGAGQIGLLAAIALFGMDYFTSFYYGTSAMMSSLHPYGLQNWGFLGAAIISLASIIFGLTYMVSLGVFNEGGGAYTASMRYLKPVISLAVAVFLIEDYTLVLVVSVLSGADQALSILNLYNIHWFWHFAIGAALATLTWYLTIRGRGESGFVAFIFLMIFVTLTIFMGIGLFMAFFKHLPPAPNIAEPLPHTFWGGLYHVLTGSMKGMVALSGLECMSNGMQFVKHEDPGFTRWGKKHMPSFKKLWEFYSGKVGIGRAVQTSFLFYGGLTTFFLTAFAIHFNAFDGTRGMSLVGNLASIGFTQFPGGILLFWAYQVLAVILLAMASITGLQDAQATEWRDVAIGEIPEAIIYRSPNGTFTRTVSMTFVAAMIIAYLLRGSTDAATPFFSVGIFVPITVMGFAMRQHFLRTYSKGARRTWSAALAGVCGVLGFIVFISQIFGKWSEGGWVRLLTFSTLIVTAHLLLISPSGYRSPGQIYRIVRTKARVQGGMASIVEWQSLKMQEYRYHLLVAIHRFWELFGVRRPISLATPPEAGDYDHALHADHPEITSILFDYMGKTERDLVASPELSSQPYMGPRKKYSKIDRFTWYSLVVVGVIFTIALNHYLVDIHAALWVHILVVAVPLTLLAVLVVLLRDKRSAVKSKGNKHILVEDPGD